jgi:hypothetical protein
MRARSRACSDSSRPRGCSLSTGPAERPPPLSELVERRHRRLGGSLGARCGGHHWSRRTSASRFSSSCHVWSSDRHRAERLSVGWPLTRNRSERWTRLSAPRRSMMSPVAARAIRRPRRVVAWRCSLGAATSFGPRARCPRGTRAHLSMGCPRLGDSPAVLLRRLHALSAAGRAG